MLPFSPPEYLILNTILQLPTARYATLVRPVLVHTGGTDADAFLRTTQFETHEMHKSPCLLMSTASPSRRCRAPRRARNGDAQNADHGGGGGKGSTLRRSGMVIGRDMRGQGYLARFEATPGGGGGGVSDELVPWEDVVAIK